MSVSANELPEYIKFLDPHLALQVIDFYISKERNPDLVAYKKQILFKTMLFEQQLAFIEENKNLFDENIKQNISSKKEQQAKDESQTKQRIIGFLNLIENCRKAYDYDTSASMSRKIVKNKIII